MNIIDNTITSLVRNPYYALGGTIVTLSFYYLYNRYVESCNSTKARAKEVETMKQRQEEKLAGYKVNIDLSFATKEEVKRGIEVICFQIRDTWKDGRVTNKRKAANIMNVNVDLLRRWFVLLSEAYEFFSRKEIQNVWKDLWTLRRSNDYADLEVIKLLENYETINKVLEQWIVLTKNEVESLDKDTLEKIIFLFDKLTLFSAGEEPHNWLSPKMQVEVNRRHFKTLMQLRLAKFELEEKTALIQRLQAELDTIVGSSMN